MEKSILDILIKKNEFPIIFIGAGIPKRYLIKYPSWEELLEEFWKKIGKDNFYGYLSQKKSELSAVSKGENIEFDVNICVASEIEKLFNEKFNSGEIKVEGLSQKDAYRKSISPFKKALANRFSKYQEKESYAEELYWFRKMLIKSQMILTTNYDSFTEDQYNNASAYHIKKYIGQRGFFQQSIGYSEIYKIHGCYTDPKSLVIGKEDYQKYDENSILISARIISMLLHSPIIFMGYSLADRNVRNLIKSFTASLSEQEKIELEKRLMLIQWDEGNNTVDEQIINDSDLGCRLTVLKTDNFKYIFEKLSEIDQGVAPSEVRRYQHVIKQLIIEKGKDGELQSVLVSPTELTDIEKSIEDQNIVVAIGDSKLIFKMPNVVDYILEYIQGDTTRQNSDTMLRFIASQNNNILPFWRYLSLEKIDKSGLAKREKEKLRKRLEKFESLDDQINALKFKEKYSSINEIEKIDKSYHRHSVVAANIDELGLEVVKNYIIEELDKIKGNGEITVETALRRLALIYDFKKNKIYGKPSI